MLKSPRTKVVVAVDDVTENVVEKAEMKNQEAKDVQDEVKHQGKEGLATLRKIDVLLQIDLDVRDDDRLFYSYDK